MNKKLLSVIALCAIVFAGCQNQPADTGNEEGISLSAKEWEWTGANKPGLFILSFNDDTRFSAKTDCNNMGGEYTADGNSLTFGDMYSTLMYCEGSQESEFSALLGKVTGYKFTDDNELVLSSKEEPELMIFQ